MGAGLIRRSGHGPLALLPRAQNWRLPRPAVAESPEAFAAGSGFHSRQSSRLGPGADSGLAKSRQIPSGGQLSTPSAQLPRALYGVRPCWKPLLWETASKPPTNQAELNLCTSTRMG